MPLRGPEWGLQATIGGVRGGHARFALLSLGHFPDARAQCDALTPSTAGQR